MSSMPDAPAYQEYPADILTNEIFVRMSYEERGLYWTLRMYSWKNKGLPKEESRLARFCQLELQEFERLWLPNVCQFFEECPEDPSRIQEVSLEIYRTAMLARRQRRHTSGKKGAEARWNILQPESDESRFSGGSEMALQ